MKIRVYILVSVLVSFFLLVDQVGAINKKPTSDNFADIIAQVAHQMPQNRSGGYVNPSDNDLREWGTILNLFRVQSLDSCKVILRKFDYSLIQLKDPQTGNVYDIIREDLPIRRGWGTYIFNRNHTKRLNIHVNHPVDDEGILTLSSQLFRRSNAEWLLIAGTSKNAFADNSSSDMGRLKQTIFQRWHEVLSDLTHVSLSLHGFNEKSYGYPIATTDIIISNGKTTDEQWGISQISLAIRDTLRTAGLSCSLAMYDSGLARLAGGWNPQGVFSNDSVGFGHWLYVELSGKIRSRSSIHSELLAIMDRALDLTGKKISQQANRAFGLVSPRVLKVDSLHRLFFPPANSEPYRIISFNVPNSRNDSLDVRMGSWVDILSSARTTASVTRLDVEDINLRGQSSLAPDEASKSVVANSVDVKNILLSSIVKLSKEHRLDSSSIDGEGMWAVEPLQVHRIPLHAVTISTISQQSMPTISASFRWEGIISPHVTPQVQTFQMSSQEEIIQGAGGLPKFLIPLITSSYHSGKSKFIGVEMTDILVNEIARLVVEHQVKDKDIGLLAEQSERGDYYLRIFPSGSIGK